MCVLKFDEEKVKRISLEELNYNPLLIGQTIDVLKGLNNELQEPLDKWLKDRTICDEFNVNGVTLKVIHEQLKWNFVDCLILMNSFIENPEDAKKVYDVPERRPR